MISSPTEQLEVVLLPLFQLIQALGNHDEWSSLAVIGCARYNEERLVTGIAELRRLFLIFLCSVVSYQGIAGERPCVAVISHHQDLPLVHRIESAIYSSTSPSPNVAYFDLKRLPNSLSKATTGYSLLVSVGEKPLRALMSSGTDLPVLSILTREHVYKDIIQNHCKQDCDTTAIYIDQPFDRQMALINILGQHSQSSSVQKPTRVGALLGPISHDQEEALHQAADNAGLQLKISRVKAGENPVLAELLLTEDIDFLLSIPDAAVHNARTARAILMSAYRKQVPIIGFSRAYVKVGGVAGVYSDPKGIANQTAQVIKGFLSSSDASLPKPMYPNHAKITLNTQAANSLAFELPPKPEIIDAMNELFIAQGLVPIEE